MNISQLYRKRIIPSECILLKDDVIIEQNEKFIITKWNTLNPKPDFSHGCSCYFLQEGIKVSKIYREDDSLLYWYCDIVDFAFDHEKISLTVTDLLADVIIHPDGYVEVLDLGELADAIEKKLLTEKQITLCLRRLDHLLTVIYRDKFDKLQAPLNNRNL